VLAKLWAREGHDVFERLQRMVQLAQKVFGVSQVGARVVRRGSANVAVITLEERWPLTPVIEFQSGGSATWFHVGATHRNLLGRYLELEGLALSALRREQHVEFVVGFGPRSGGDATCSDCFRCRTTR
jgi:hypothetical protein